MHPSRRTRLGRLALGLLLLLAPLPAGASGPPETLAEIRRLAADAIPLLAVHTAPRSLPAHVFRDREGGETSLADWRGRIVLVNFWATWCPPCRHEMPSLDRLQAALGGPDFAVLAISLDRNGRERAEAFYDERELAALDIHLDPKGEASGKLKVVSLPTTLLIDRSGDEIGRIAGAVEWDSPAALAFFRALSAPVEAAATGDRAACAAEPCRDR